MAIEKVDVTLTGDDFNNSGMLKAENLFRYLQKAAANQTVKYGVSVEELIELGYMWVLTKMKVIINSDISPGRKYTFATFPLHQKRATFKREFFVCETEKYAGLDSPMAAVGTSQWCVMDFATRKLVRRSPAGEAFEKACEETELIPGPIEKIKGTTLEYAGTHVVVEEDLDSNRHTNNCRYLTMAESCIDRQGNTVIVNYVMETRLGDEIRLYKETGVSGSFIEGRRADENGAEEKVFEVYFGD
ncbi:MAG: acyl-ACP thioesterase domain-containing protein [Lentihominibacter sp.]